MAAAPVMSIQTIAGMDVEVDGDVMRIRRSAERRGRDTAAVRIGIAAGILIIAVVLTAAWRAADVGRVTIAAVCLVTASICACTLVGAARALRASRETDFVLDRSVSEYRLGDRRLGPLSEVASISVEPITPRQHEIIRIYAHTVDGLLHAIPDEQAHYNNADHAGELGGHIAEFLHVPFADKSAINSP
jgi:hypothetical protein